MDTFAEIIENMFGFSVHEFTIMTIDSIAYLAAIVLVFSTLIKLLNVTKSKNAKGILLCLFATVVSSFVAFSVTDSSEVFGILEVTALLVPSIFTLLAAVYFYRLGNELALKYS